MPGERAAKAGTQLMSRKALLVLRALNMMGTCIRSRSSCSICSGR
jgi:hypothetical protein